MRHRSGLASSAPRLLGWLGALVGALGSPCAQQLSFEHYPPELLPQVAVQAMTQDRDGYLWLGTQDGVARYDGSEFRHYGAREGLQGAFIRRILQDSRGRIWVATGQGLGILRDERFVTYGPEHGMTGEHVLVVVEAPDGTMYAGTGIPAGLTALRLVGGSDEPELATVDIGPLDDVYNVEDLAVGDDGQLYVATHGGGLRVVSSDGQVRVLDPSAGFPGAVAGPLLLAADGTLYAGANAGLARYAAGELVVWGSAQGMPPADVDSLALGPSGELYVGTADGAIYRVASPGSDPPGQAVGVAHGLADAIVGLVVDRRGLVWGAGSGTGLIQHDPRDGSVHVVDREHGLGTDTVVRCVLEDREGNLWVGTSTGLHRLKSAAFVNYLTNDGLPHDHVWCVLRAGSRLLVGTSDGLGVLSDGRWRTLRVAHGMAGNDIRALAAASPERVFAGGPTGLTRLDFEGDRLRLTTYDASDGMPHERVSCLGVDSRGTLWVGTWEGLARLEGEVMAPVAEVGRVSVWAIEEDAAGRVWVGSHLALFMIDGTRVERYTKDNGLLDTFALSLADDGQAHLWVAYGASSVGVSRLRLSSPTGPRLDLEHFSSEDGLPSDRVFFVGSDRRGQVWLGTSRGIARYRPNARGRGFEVLNQDNGLPWNDCSHNGFSADPDGTFWFGTGRGLSHFLPELEVHDRPPPPVAFTGVTLGGIPAAPGAQVPYARRDLNARFTALSYVAERAITFRHRLLGYRDGWSDFAPVRSATFTNLPPGAYELEVEARAGDGTVSASPARFAWRVLPPWWQTWWLRLIAAASLLLVAVAVHRLRTRHIQRRNLELEALVAARTHTLQERSRELEEANVRILEADRMKSRFLARMSHELRTPLNSIIGFSEILATRLETMAPDKCLHFLHNINSSGTHLLNLINNILDLSKIEAGKTELHLEEVSVAEAVESARRVMLGIADKRYVEIAVTAPEPGPMVWMDATKLKQILFNLLSNAVKFSPDGDTVELTARMVAAPDSALGVESLELEVSDHGPGIDPEDLPHVFEEFRQLHGGATSQEKSGTGLGLTLTRRLVEFQGGLIEVSSKVGEGTTFEVLLPIACHGQERDTGSD